MINFEIEKIAPLCEEFGVSVTDEIKERLNLYGNLLIEWNEKINLTAIIESEAVLYKHFYDCILFLKHIKIKENATLIDVGTGAGFPGMVLKIMREDIKVTLLDSLNKRLIFLNDVIEKLNLDNIETVHMRAEQAGQSNLYREKYDIACARAVANLPALMEYCVPLVKKGGVFVAMKGPSGSDEAAASLNAAKILGASDIEVLQEKLPTDDQRSFCVTKKISQTPSKYPRKPSDISKQPL